LAGAAELHTVDLYLLVTSNGVGSLITPLHSYIVL